MRSLFTAIRAIVYVTVFVTLWRWVALGLGRLDPDLKTSLPPGVEGPGLVLIAAGGLLVLACVWSFVLRGRGTPAVFDPPRVFVPSGPYRYVRNPMYIGASLVLAGYGLFLRSGAVLLLSLVFLVLFHLFVVFVEEPGLEDRFGETYVAYKRSVNRWLPRLRPRSA